MPAVLIGSGGEIARIPETRWRRGVQEAATPVSRRLAFMTPNHHRVRDFVVRELPGRRAGLRAAEVARELSLPAEAVERILSELERNLFFLVRDEAAAVRWAYTVTIDRTPHRLRFSSGERSWGA